MKQLICQFLDQYIIELDRNPELTFAQKINDLIEKIKTLKQINYVFEVDGKCKVSSSACQSNLYKIPTYSQLNEISVDK